MAETPEQIRASLRATISADLAAWEAAAESDSHRYISDVSWIVAVDGLGLNVTGNVATPVRVTPGFVGITVMLRKDAERIAKLRGAGFKPHLMRDYPALRVAELRAMLAALPAPVAPATGSEV